MALFMEGPWLLGQFEDHLLHAKHGWSGPFHRCQVYPWITACTRGPCHPSHGQKSRTRALVPWMGDGPWIKVRIYTSKKRNSQSILTQGILKPCKVFLNDILSKPRNSMFCVVTNEKSVPQTEKDFCGSEFAPLPWDSTFQRHRILCKTANLQGWQLSMDGWDFSWITHSICR